jgi:uncharacterized protein (TIGR02265 family)
MTKGMRPPDFTSPIDVEAHISRLPANATTKGMFFNALIDRVGGRASRSELMYRAGLPESTRFLPFRDYPMAANIRLTVAVAVLLYEREPMGVALHALGRVAVDAFRESHMGRIVLDALNMDPATLFRLAPRIYGALFNFGRIDFESVTSTRCRMYVRSMPIFIETFQVGAIESALELSRARGKVELSLDSIADAVVEVSWE